MTLISKDDLREQLRKREISPVYALFGEETYLRDIAAKTIADLSFAEGDFRDFNDDKFSLNTADSLRAALSAAEQLPMMVARRVVRITDVRVSSTSNKDTLKEDSEAALAAYLANPSPSSVVIFVADELSGNRKLTKLLKAKAAAVEFAKLDDSELTKWARDMFAERGCEIDPAVPRKLIGLVGSDLRRLKNEVEKLSTAALQGKVVTAELVDSLVPNSREISNFDLTDHLLAGERRKALEILKKILDDGAEPLALLGLIASNYRRSLMQMNLAADNSRSDRFAATLKRLAETDLAIKTSLGGGGQAGARLQIEMLVCELSKI
ncbi:MAG: DNA polymerase III subunit delta [Blastocatellia bacterium]